MPQNIKQNDTAPSASGKLLLNNQPFAGLAGATVRFHMKHPEAAVAKVAAPAVIEDQGQAIVRYDWQIGDTDTPGLFNIEWEVTTSDGRIVTFPNDGHEQIEIEEELA